MTDALMPRPTQPLDEDPGPDKNVPRPSRGPNADRGKLYTYGALLLLALGFFVAARSWVVFGTQPDVGIPVGLFTQTDFPAVVIASRLVASGTAGPRLYDQAAQLDGQRLLTRQGYLRLSPNDPQLHYPYPYTPILALAWAPFTLFSPLASMALWDLLNIVAFMAGLLVLVADLPLPRLLRALLILGVITSLPWVVNLEQGQSTGFIALGLALGVVALRRWHGFSAGLAFGLLFLKLQWLPVIVLMLLLKGRWRALAGLALVGLALGLETTLVLGPSWLPAYFGVLTTATRSGSAYLLTPAASHSLNGGIYALLGPGNASLVTPLTLLGTIAILGLLAWVWLYTPRARVFSWLNQALTWQPGTPAWDARVALTLLVAILTNLQLNTHDLSLLVLPATLGFSSLYGLWAERDLKGAPPTYSRIFPALWHACLWLLYFTPLLLLDRILDPTNPLPIRLTTWLMVLMLGLLAALGVRTVRET
jgi:hypothetical protein